MYDDHLCETHLNNLGRLSHFDLETSRPFLAQMFLYTMPATWLWGTMYALPARIWQRVCVCMRASLLISYNMLDTCLFIMRSFHVFISVASISSLLQLGVWYLLKNIWWLGSFPTVQLASQHLFYFLEVFDYFAFCSSAPLLWITFRFVAVIQVHLSSPKDIPISLL